MRLNSELVWHWIVLHGRGSYNWGSCIHWSSTSGSNHVVLRTAIDLGLFCGKWGCHSAYRKRRPITCIGDHHYIHTHVRRLCRCYRHSRSKQQRSSHAHSRPNSPLVHQVQKSLSSNHTLHLAFAVQSRLLLCSSLVPLKIFSKEFRKMKIMYTIQSIIIVLYWSISGSYLVYSSKSSSYGWLWP